MSVNSKKSASREFCGVMNEIGKFKTHFSTDESDKTICLSFNTELTGQIHLRFVDDSRKWLKKVVKRYGGIHEPGLSKAIIALSSLYDDQVSVYFDVGNHLGYYGVLIDQTFDCEKIIGFEMNPESAAIAKNNFSFISNAGSASIVNAGVSKVSQSSVPCAYKIYKLLANVDESDKTNLSNKGFRFTDLDLITLDDFCAQNSVMPDLVKIDIEGSQMSVLQGMKGILSSKKPILMIESDEPSAHNSDGAKMSEICELLLTEYSYEILSFDHRSWDFKCESVTLESLKTNIDLEKNAFLLCLPHQS